MATSEMDLATMWPANATTAAYSEAAVENTTDQHPTDVDLQMYAIFVPLVWGILTIVGAFGNAIVIVTLIRHGDKNATNNFVINLAISDFAFVVIVVPFTATLYALPEWVFGDGMCKITMYMIYVTLNATCLTLMAMTIDRFCAIVYAVQSRNWRTSTASMIVCLVVWCVSIVISLPFAIFFRTVPQYHGNETLEYCMDVWPEPHEAYSKASIIVVVFTTYVVPLTVIIFCYAMILSTLWRNKTASGYVQSDGISSKKAKQQENRKKRVTKLVATIVIVFALFWLPIHIINLWFKLDQHFPRTDTMYIIKIISHTLSYANSCVNPFVYAFLSAGFRKALSKTFPSLAHRYRTCRRPTEEGVTNVSLIDRNEPSKSSMTTVFSNGQEERQQMQTGM